MKTREDATQKSLLTSLRTGTYTAAIPLRHRGHPLTYFVIGPENNSWGVFIAILCGLIGGTPHRLLHRILHLRQLQAHSGAGCYL